MSDNEPTEEPLLGSRILVEKWIWSYILGIHRVVERYEEQREISARAQRMKEASARLESTNHTSRVHDQLAAEANADPPLLKALIQKEIEKRDTKLGAAEEKIKKLEKALKQAKAKKATTTSPSNAKNGKGAAKSGATAKKSPSQSTPKSKKSGQGAADADNDTQRGALQNGQNCSTGKQRRRRSKSRGRRRNSSGASRRN